MEQLQTLLTGALEARGRVLVKLNVEEANLQAVIDLLPALKSPTVSKLHGEDGYAVETVVAKSEINVSHPRAEGPRRDRHPRAARSPRSSSRRRCDRTERSTRVSRVRRAPRPRHVRGRRRHRVPVPRAPASRTARARSRSARPSSSRSSPATSAAGKPPRSARLSEGAGVTPRTSGGCRCRVGDLDEQHLGLGERVAEHGFVLAEAGAQAVDERGEGVDRESGRREVGRRAGGPARRAA